MNQKSTWKDRQEKAVAIGVGWVDDWIQKYDEPTRAGTPRGEPIGFSKKKMRAAFLMILHNALGLREISKLAGVSEGFIRVWRTQTEFIDVAKEACEDFGAHIMDTIDREFEAQINKGMGTAGDDSKPGVYLEITGLGPHTYLDLIEVLPFFNSITIERVLSLLKEKTEAKIFRYIVLFPLFLKSLSFYGDPSDLSWAKGEGVLNGIKFQIAALISNFTDPQLRRDLDDQAAKRIGSLLQKTVFEYFDLLAGV